MNTTQNRAKVLAQFLRAAMKDLRETTMSIALRQTPGHKRAVNAFASIEQVAAELEKVAEPNDSDRLNWLEAHDYSAMCYNVSDDANEERWAAPMKPNNGWIIGMHDEDSARRNPQGATLRRTIDWAMKIESRASAAALNRLATGIRRPESPTRSLMTSIALNEPLHLIALNRPELESAHAKMIEWAKARRDKVDVDLDVEETNRGIALQNKWLTAPFERRIRVLARQRTFYDKIVAALEAGWAIVPNFPMTIFAVRTKARKPSDRARDGQWNVFTQPAQLLPIGEGRYVSSALDHNTDSDTTKDSAGREVTKYFQWPTDEFNDVEFPFALARPELMTTVGTAMAAKVFDEIGVAMDGPNGGRSGDPILIGRIRNPRDNRPSLSFFLGWYFDPSRL